MLHYQEGEFYKEHHDYDGKHLEEPSGPRVFTFFLYLNDVEEVRRLTGGALLFLNSGAHQREGPSRTNAVPF